VREKKGCVNKRVHIKEMAFDIEEMTMNSGEMPTDIDAKPPDNAAK
jgi:hypothetical protein